MIKDLKRSQEKPVVSNKELIPEKRAKVFPFLDNLKSLRGGKVDLPEFFLRKNRSHDVDAQCTLVAISFRDFGYNLLASWLDPFAEAMTGKDRVEVVRLNLSEGWVNKWILRGFITGLTKRNTPQSEQDRTFLYFGDLESFRDSLRMHNVMTGYVFLLDGLGRVRFAGSGPASEEEAERLIRFAKELTPLIVKTPVHRNKAPTRLKPTRGRRTLRK
jgi:ATPase complex subunit ATP10